MGDLERPLSEVRAARAARLAWGRAADVWEDFVETGKDYSRDRVHGPALLRVLGPVSRLRVLDLGCGHGYFTRKLARRGARVVGVDWSQAMIVRAQRIEEKHPLGIEYRRLDAREVGMTWPSKSFDRIVGCMSFMDTPGLKRLLRAAHGLLRPKGRLVFSVTHPMNSSPVSRWESPRIGAHGARVLDRYFDEGPVLFTWRMQRLQRSFAAPYWHLTLSGWFRNLREAGFALVDLREPRPTAPQAFAEPGLEGPRRVPFWLIFDCEKRPE